MEKVFAFVEIRGLRVRIYSGVTHDLEGRPKFSSAGCGNKPLLYPGLYRVPLAELWAFPGKGVNGLDLASWTEKGYRIGETVKDLPRLEGKALEDHQRRRRRNEEARMSKMLGQNKP